MKTILFSSIGKKLMMALTGSCLAIFLIVHLLGNTTIFLGRVTFLSYAEHLHSIGPVLHVFEFGLLAIFLIHIFFGATLFFENLSARPNRYAVDKEAGGRTLGSKTMPYSGAVVLIFTIVHLMNFHFTDKSIPIADIVGNALSHAPLALFYILGLVAVGLHASHGFWSLWQTLGVNHPRYNPILQNGALVISTITAAIFILIPVLLMLSPGYLQ